MENDFINFNARFGGVSREISIPVDNVAAIYASENGQGMAFDVSRADEVDTAESATADDAPALAAVSPTDAGSAADTSTDTKNEPDPPKKGGKPVLTRIK